MWSGTCELYAGTNKYADGNGGWSCYTCTDGSSGQQIVTAPPVTKPTITAPAPTRPTVTTPTKP